MTIPVDRKWPHWIGYAAAAWAAAYALLGLYWSLGGPGFPFGTGDPDPGVRDATVLGRLTPGVGGPVIAVAGFAGALLALALARRVRLGRVGAALAWGFSVVLVVVIQDYRPLVALGHLLILPIVWALGLAPGVTLASQLPWPVLNLCLCLLGGLLFAGTAVSYQRHRNQGSERGTPGRGWTSPASAARWGVWAVWIAATVPALYALTRWAWFLGIPLGFTSRQLRDMNQEAPGIWLAGALLGTFAVGGSILTLGLIQRWGEVFPRWIPGLRGRRVPILLAVIPATLVGLCVLAAGNTMVIGMFRHAHDPAWLVIGAAGALWPFWGAGLLAATLAYYYRRRGGCARCG